MGGLEAPSHMEEHPMYLPDHFRVDDIPQMHDLMRSRPFAALVSSGATGLYASHLPTVLKDEGDYGTIECHLARGNPHWRAPGGTRSWRSSPQIGRAHV